MTLVSKVWCDRAPYFVHGGVTDVRYQIERAAQEGYDFVYLDRTSGNQVCLRIDRISAIELSPID